ncbi:MAG: DNA-3-methyladenine glycosylase 2 family protein [Alphaproteobacteria bacterium]|nr:DNA-3-methyladenine glycosylase 2 family protein [Alphaproteobacteria bacterium]MCZ6588058.1 DNA-3-methyladenine glycosylase 2 family protein [Alphaproteobacteria bacterium]MCZ6840616.1 DNA-3-methyladenine glycosylase 2 family protein [Alphaproteobacteria bacterium]
MKTRKRIEAGLSELARIDPRIGTLWETAGTPPPRARKQGYTTLLRIIVGQQLSTKAAASIWQRLEDAGTTGDPSNFLAQSDQSLRSFGLSRQKISYGRGLAAAIESGTVNLAQMGRMSDEDAIATLIALKGIGRWSAEVYLLFALGRADVMPADDLALVVSAGRHLGDGERWTPAQLRAEADMWQPWRSAAARLLWHAYRIEAI